MGNNGGVMELEKKIDKLCHTIYESDNSIVVQLARIHTKQNEPCEQVTKTATSLRWLWLMFLGGFGALSIVIGYFHAR